MVFVGQNPGAQEDQQGEAFVGPTGQLVRGNQKSRGVYLDSLSFRTRASVYLTNTARCATFGEEEPTNSNYSTCFPHTASDLALVSSVHHSAERHLVLLGAKAVFHTFKWATGKSRSLDKILAGNGVSLELPGAGLWRIWATWHPAYLLRNKKLIHSVSDHLRLISDGLAGLTSPPSVPSTIPPILPTKYKG